MTRNLPEKTVPLLLAFALAALLYMLAATFSGAVAEAGALTLFSRWLFYFGLPWLVLAPLLLWGTRRFLLLPVPGRSNLRFCLLACIVVPALHSGLMALLRLIQTTGTTLPGSNDVMVPTLPFLLFNQGFLLIDVLVCVVIVTLALLHLQQAQLRLNDEESYRLGRHLQDTRLQNLAMQLNPHFLFNTLNGLSVLIDKQHNEEASEMVGELSKFLRQVLRTTREKWVTLDQELAFIRQYLHIEQYRFGKRLTWFEDCEPLALTAHIPPMLLQPLFENAIVHGLADKQGECRLGFECRLYDRFLVLHIFDNGGSSAEERNAAPGSGIGLSNIRARLRALYGDSHSLTMERKPDGTLVTLKLPAFKDSQFGQRPE